MGSTKANQVLSFDFAVTVEDFEDGAKKIVKHVRPKWDTERLKFKIFTDGITNKLMGCFLEEDHDDLVLVRINGEGSDVIIDRTAELANFKILSANGCAPDLYATFQNGLAYGFFPGTPLCEKSVRQPNIQRLVAEELARMHGIKDGQSGELGSISALFKDKVQGYLNAFPASLQDPVKQKNLVEKLPNKVALVKEFKLIIEQLEALQMKVVFCHNDLLLKNIIYNEKKGSVHFIDYEYAFYNYDAYDIGDHFTEYAGITDIDYSLYPIKQQQWPFLKQYLLSTAKLNGNSEDSVSEKDVERLYIQVNKCACASHFFWAVWAVIQAEHSTIDFDYIGFADIRLTEYFKRKEEFYPLQLPL